jgi:hypothetical protein
MTSSWHLTEHTLAKLPLWSPIAKSADNPVVRMSQPFSMLERCHEASSWREIAEPGLGDFLSEGAQVILTDKVAFSSVHCLRTGPEIAFWRQSSE